MNYRLACLFITSIGCAASPDLEDGIDDDFSDGKTDSAGIDESSPEACGVLHVANTASLDILDDDVGLSSRTAKNIVDRRSYSTLAALDAVPYVGPAALRDLLAWAIEHGDVDACTPTPAPTCTTPHGAFVSDELPFLYQHSVALRPNGSATPDLLSAAPYELTHLYFDSTALLSSKKTGSTWTSERIDHIGGMTSQYTDPWLLATAPSDSECYALVKTDGRLLVNCTSFGTQIVTQGLNSDASMLAMGRTGNELQFVYSASPSRHLLWRSYTTSPGPVENVGTSLPIGGYSDYEAVSLAIDSHGQPHVAFVVKETPTNDRLEYAFRSASGTWTQITVAPTLATDSTATFRASDQRLSLILVGDKPVIAYHDPAARSLVFARQLANGTFQPHTLVTPPAEFPTSSAGFHVALQADCENTVRILYTRFFETDQCPTTGPCATLRYGRISNDALVDEVILRAGVAVSTKHGLDYRLDPAGHEQIAVAGNNSNVLLTR